MYKTFYLSIDRGYSYKRFTKDESNFKHMIWDICMKALYPEGVIHKSGEPLAMTIREPRQMMDNYTYYVHGNYTIDDVWDMIIHMWDFVTSKM